MIIDHIAVRDFDIFLSSAGREFIHAGEHHPCFIMDSDVRIDSDGYNGGLITRRFRIYCSKSLSESLNRGEVVTISGAKFSVTEVVKTSAALKVYLQEVI